MGNSTIAAVVAVFLTVVMTAMWFTAESPMSAAQPGWHLEEHGLQGVQASHTLRGQAWATELFGRRHGRNLMA